MKTIPLTQGRFALIDDEDFEKVSKLSWRYGSRGYAVTWMGHGIKNRWLLRMQHLIVNPKPGVEVDHKNGDRLDNRRDNLRKCTCGQNNANRGLSCVNTSGFKGVRLRSWGWIAHIGFKYRKIHLGTFRSAKEAALAYDAAAIKYFGKFSKTNAMLGLL